MNNKEPRKPRSAAVSVRIQANTYSNLRKIQDELSQEMGGVNLTLSQVIAIVVIEYGTARAAGVDVPSMKDEDYTIPQYGQKSWKTCKQIYNESMAEDEAVEAAWREIQEEEAGRIEAQEREWAEDEGRDPAELTSIDVLGRR